MRRPGGFSLIESVVTIAIFSIVTLVGASFMTNLGSGLRTVATQGANVELANELRGLVSRQATCANSMVGRPSGYGGVQPVAIRLGAAGAVVQAGATLPDLGLAVQSLSLRNIVAAGSVNGGHPLYYGDLVVTTKSRDAAVAAFRSITVARLALETNGASLLNCYASDTQTDATQTLSSMCGRITSPQGQPSQYVNGQCRVADVDIGTTCGQMGGAWNGSSCVIRRRSFIVSRYIPAGTFNNGTGYGVSCPSGSILTGGACTSEIPPRIPVGGMYLGGGYSNYYGCAWQLGYEDVGYMIYGACLQ